MNDSIFWRSICLLVRVAAWGYLATLFAWLVAYLSSGDRFGYLGAFNLIAVYLFFPLPAVLLGALFCRSKGLLAGFALGLAAFLALWGAQFAPNRWPLFTRAQAGGPTLTVMTYNVLAWHRHVRPVIDTIRAEDADVVCIQELNRSLALELQTQLGEEYPYQLHEPRDTPAGIGLISKHPIRPTGASLPHVRWIGGPQVLELDWDGQKITLVNFHMTSTPAIAAQPIIDRDFRAREEQARLLAGLARRAAPAVMCGDANAVPLNQAYKILAGPMHDAWRQAGFGLGHTFPGSDIPESDRPKIGDWHVPQWLARIDYVFHTPEFETVAARLARFDGVSDHRGVVAVLVLKNGFPDDP